MYPLKRVVSRNHSCHDMPITQDVQEGVIEDVQEGVIEDVQEGVIEDVQEGVIEDVQEGVIEIAFLVTGHFV